MAVRKLQRTETRKNLVEDRVGVSVTRKPRTREKKKSLDAIAGVGKSHTPIHISMPMYTIRQQEKLQKGRNTRRKSVKKAYLFLLFD